MKVKTGTKTVSGQEIEVELEDSDGFLQFSNWEALSVIERYKKLAAFADVLLVDYLSRAGHISNAERDQRLSSLAKDMK